MWYLFYVDGSKKYMEQFNTKEDALEVSEHYIDNSCYILSDKEVAMRIFDVEFRKEYCFYNS